MSRPVLIGVCLCLMQMVSAVAGEAPFGKAKPVARAEHPRDDHCAALYGAGYTDLGGTAACVKISGRVRVDFGVTSGGGLHGASAAPLPFAPLRAPAFGSAAEAAVEADVRTTFVGQPLRVFSRVRGGSGSDLLLGGARP